MKSHSLKSIILLFAFSIFSCANSEKKSDMNVGKRDLNSNDVELEKIKIGNQIWTSKNLESTIFRNGDSIPEAKSYEDWKSYSKNKKAAWCYFKFEKKYGDRYGKLYNRFAITDPRNLAPVGWKVPSFTDFEELENSINEPIDDTINEFNSKKSIGYKLKSQEGWLDYDDQNGNGSNQVGFNVLPGGYAWISIIEGEGKYFEGISFEAEGEETYFWTSESERFNYHFSNGWINSITTGFVEQSAAFCCVNDFGFYVRLISEK
jgi:uncharacterized protein (TIGR02145 family)